MAKSYVRTTDGVRHEVPQKVADSVVASRKQFPNREEMMKYVESNPPAKPERVRLILGRQIRPFPAFQVI